MTDKEFLKEKAKITSIRSKIGDTTTDHGDIKRKMSKNSEQLHI